MYNVYNNMPTSEELWDLLQKKYKTEDVVLKKFFIVKFLNYKMIDKKPIII